VDNDLSPLADTEVHYLWSARAETEYMPPDQQAKTGARYIDIVDDMARMAGRLQRRRYPALNLRSETFPGEFLAQAKDA